MVHATRLVRRVVDPSRQGSLSTNLRRRRLAPFISLLEALPRPVRMLDVGGTQAFWEAVGYLCGDRGVQVVILNIVPVAVRHPNFSSLVGDARDLSRFGDAEFDVVFSNSVIQELGDFREQQKMAAEVLRVGRRLYVQAPSRYFPVEPHFLFPGFQFLPVAVRAWLLTRFSLGWYSRFSDRAEAAAVARSKRLVSRREMKRLFPEARIVGERWMGLVKSYSAYQGWPSVSRR